MNFKAVSNDPFKHYFYKRTQLADDMTASGSALDAYTLATASLEALAEIWFNPLILMLELVGHNHLKPDSSSHVIARSIGTWQSNLSDNYRLCSTN